MWSFGTLRCYDVRNDAISERNELVKLIDSKTCDQTVENFNTRITKKNDPLILNRKAVTVYHA